MSTMGTGAIWGLSTMEQPSLQAQPFAEPERKEWVFKGLTLANTFLSREWHTPLQLMTRGQS